MGATIVQFLKSYFIIYFLTVFEFRYYLLIRRKWSSEPRMSSNLLSTESLRRFILKHLFNEVFELLREEFGPTGLALDMVPPEEVESISCD